MGRGPAFHGGLTCLACAAVGVGCNSVFDITEGVSRSDGGAGLAAHAGGASNGAAGGTNGVPKGGTLGKGGASSGGAAGLVAGSPNVAGSGGNGGSGDNPANGGSGATEGGADPGTGGSSENGGTDANAGSGASSGAGGTGGSNGGTGGSAAGMSGTAGQGPLNIIDGRDFLIWPRCDADNSGFETTCKFYGMQGPSACNNPDLPFDQSGAFLKETIPVGGSNGTVYHVQVRVTGAATTRCYRDGQLAPVGTPGGTQNIYVGGTPTESTWTSFELHSYDAGGKPQGVYYLNAAPDPSSPNVHCETYSTQQLFNVVTLDLPGAGYVETVVHDTDCVMDTNCEANKTWCVPIGPTGVTDPLPPEFVPDDAGGSVRMIPKDTRYGANNTAQYPQFIYVDVQDVTSGPQ